MIPWVICAEKGVPSVQGCSAAYFFGLWAPTILPLCPTRHFSHGSLSSLVFGLCMDLDRALEELSPKRPPLAPKASSIMASGLKDLEQQGSGTLRPHDRVTWMFKFTGLVLYFGGYRGQFPFQVAMP